MRVIKKEKGFNMLAEKKNNQFDALSQALIRQQEKNLSAEESMAVLFMGQQFDSFPRDLLLDNSITSVDKYAWQRLYIELQQNRNYFPTYDNLQMLWGNMGGILSRKTVREILSRLVLSGWLSFKVIRGHNGQIAGNVYMLHNSQLPLVDIITQNDESVFHILSSLMSKKDISRSLAILTYNQIKNYLMTKKQINHLFLKIKDDEKEMNITHNIDEIAPSLLTHLENILNSKNKLSKKTQNSKKELSKKTPSSNLELGKNELSSKNELSIKSNNYINPSNISSIYSSTSTNDDSHLVIPSNIKVRLTEKGLRDIVYAIKKTGITVVAVNQIFQSISVSDITKIKNMTAYLVRNIQKASNGEYNLAPYPHAGKQEQTLPYSSNISALEAGSNDFPIQKKVVSKARLAELFNPLKSLLEHNMV